MKRALTTRTDAAAGPAGSGTSSESSGVRTDLPHDDRPAAPMSAWTGRSGVAAEQAKEVLLTEAAALTDDPVLTNLLPAYYRYVPADEIVGRAAEDLLLAVASHRELATHRVPGQLALEVTTPPGPDTGWCGGHTVIEIVTDDMPFLVDSVTAELSRHEIGIHLLVHPQIVVRREVLGALVSVHPEHDPDDAGEGLVVESWMHIEVDRQSDPQVLRRLRNELQRVLTDVRDAVEDWERMRDKATALADELAAAMLPVPDKDVTDACGLLRWLADDHFTFLGYREYVLTGEGEDRCLEALLSSGLGVLRGDASQPRKLAELAPEVRAKILEQRLLIITKANSRSTVHRPAYLDYLGFKTFDEAGNVTGERRFLGLFSSAAYLESVRKLPVVSRKVEEVLERSGLSTRSHSGKDLLQILETYPRDELFQISTNELYDTAMAVLRLAGRRQLRLFARRDAYGRFISCLVYLPRDRYTTQNRLRMQEILMEALHGIGVDYTTRVTESLLARVRFVVRTDPSAPVGAIDIEALQERLSQVTRSWDDDLAAELACEVAEDQAAVLLRRYATAFPEAYKAEHPPAAAVADIARIEVLEEPGGLGMHLYRDAEGGVRFTVYRLTEPMALSDVLPVLHALGMAVVDERPYRIRRNDGRVVWVYDFGLRVVDQPGTAAAGGGPHAVAGPVVDVDRVAGAVENAFAACWRGECEVDGFNALVLTAGLSWSEVVVLRAYAKYLRQAGAIYSQEYMERVMVGHPAIARQLVELFRARFDPSADATGEERAAELTASVNAALDEVASLDADRMLRSFLTLILATLRTNHFQRGDGGRHKPYLSLKIDPQSVPDLPKPRPKFEIFVYGPRVEGVHLRFGAVARGGLRWSDRREDFRTEVLGLVKAQMVKNAVIVPVGAKGGFVVKNPPPAGGEGGGREALLAEGIACYRMFISGLLDVTDNLVAGKVVPPVNVVRHDGDDAYLVVAADKGTATFSDIANAIALDYGFWLGDAFASGGSAGYDHKAMGITARGAWESVRHHFRELGVDTQSQDFTVVGVGDMSGDVFGNGMLLSEHIRLVAAFDHRHVFVDPDPDPTGSHAERRRLFALPRSSWADYDTALISAGGGVWPRTAKSVPVSPEARAVLGLPDTVTRLSPAELIRAILLAPVDLLWNGGIGTYVKAAGESHAEVGDKSNDAVRVDGAQLRCKVVGEGGNLGLTQRGRIEYALAGGRINTDAIDNSAGVDTSDHEVNIKILLGQAIEAGELTGAPATGAPAAGAPAADRPAADRPAAGAPAAGGPTAERDALLAAMTDEVAALVLADNVGQNGALGIGRHLAARMFSVHRRLMTELERAGRLDRALEFLPDEETCEQRAAAGIGLTSPELAVLLAYVKIGLEDDLLRTSLPQEPWCGPVLADYFPTPLRTRFHSQREGHPLRREIIVTSLVNDMVNHGGISFSYRVVEETGARVEDVVRAFRVICEVFDLRGIWAATRALDNVVPTSAQTVVLADVRRVVDRGVRWLLQSRSGAIDVDTEIDRLRPGVLELLEYVPELFVGRERDALRTHLAASEAAGVPRGLAWRAMSALYGFGLLDVVEIAGQLGRPPREVADVYYAVSERFHVDGLLDRISALPRDDHWQSLARMALRYDLYGALAGLTREVLESTADGVPAADRVRRWTAANEATIARVLDTLGELPEDGPADLATLSVVLRQIRTVVRASAAPS